MNTTIGKFGRLGTGNERNCHTPHLVEAMVGKRPKQVSCGGFHTAVVTEGMSNKRQLSDDTSCTCCVIPFFFLLLNLTSNSSESVLKDGKLFTTGGGEHGQLGHNDRVNRLKPTLVQALDGEFVSEITCGWSHSVALTSKGQVYTWGNSDHGKICVIFSCVIF